MNCTGIEILWRRNIRNELKLNHSIKLTEYENAGLIKLKFTATYGLNSLKTKLSTPDQTGSN